MSTDAGDQGVEEEKVMRSPPERLEASSRVLGVPEEKGAGM